ncbi:class I SAM-dependent methyltransferase [Nitrincola alkalilacustris]|uniref:class I SAM-dependent methyltransferase n=1 Tax=Nitrincola alkalilacustris TaxID=1571224 RepID=UPI00124C409A|nr:class I SAM-dependent methyltransferase [Nitrincola alkalilacustris]
MKFEQLIPPDKLVSEISAWFSTPVGQEFLAIEQELVSRLLPTLFGYHLVQVGFDCRYSLYADSPISHKVMLCPRLELGMGLSSIIGLSTELPLLSNEVDLLILHHTLDFSENPHQVLRESARVVRPGGHLLIVGFNPTSLWGLWSRFKRRKGVPWNAHALSHGRLQDWLGLLELTELKSMSGYHRPPVSSQRWRERCTFLERWGEKSPACSGGLMVILARKDVAGMTPLKPALRHRKLISFPVAEPTARGKST